MLRSVRFAISWRKILPRDPHTRTQSVCERERFINILFRIINTHLTATVLTI